MRELLDAVWNVFVCSEPLFLPALPPSLPSPPPTAEILVTQALADTNYQLAGRRRRDRYLNLQTAPVSQLKKGGPSFLPRCSMIVRTEGILTGNGVRSEGRRGISVGCLICQCRKGLPPPPSGLAQAGILKTCYAELRRKLASAKEGWGEGGSDFLLGVWGEGSSFKSGWRNCNWNGIGRICMRYIYMQSSAAYFWPCVHVCMHVWHGLGLTVPFVDASNRDFLFRWGNEQKYLWPRNNQASQLCDSILFYASGISIFLPYSECQWLDAGWLYIWLKIQQQWYN